MQRIIISQETRSIGSVTSLDHKELSKTMKCRHIALMDGHDQYELSSEETRLRFTNRPTNDSKCQHRSSCMLTSSHPLMRRTNTCPSVVLFSCARIPSIQTQLRVFHASHEEESDLFPFMDYLIQLQESVKKYLFHELPIENTPEINRDYHSTIVCPFCHSKLDNGEIAEIFEGDSLDAFPR